MLIDGWLAGWLRSLRPPGLGWCLGTLLKGVIRGLRQEKEFKSSEVALARTVRISLTFTFQNHVIQIDVFNYSCFSIGFCLKINMPHHSELGHPGKGPGNVESIVHAASRLPSHTTALQMQAGHLLGAWLPEAIDPAPTHKQEPGPLSVVFVVVCVLVSRPIFWLCGLSPVYCIGPNFFLY